MKNKSQIVSWGRETPYLQPDFQVMHICMEQGFAASVGQIEGMPSDNQDPWK